MARKILFGVAAVLAVLALYVDSRPSEFRVQRTAVVPAPPAAVYARLVDFARWADWSPWEKLDPAMKRTLTGAPGSVGHAYAWAGNDAVGEGRMTITGLLPGERVDLRLEFLEPWSATNATAFTIEPEGAGSRVTWSMSGTSGFVAKAMGLFMDMDAMIGKDFEAGLRSLGEVAARDAAAGAGPAPAP